MMTTTVFLLLVAFGIFAILSIYFIASSIANSVAQIAHYTLSIEDEQSVCKRLDRKLILAIACAVIAIGLLITIAIIIAS